MYAERREDAIVNQHGGPSGSGRNSPRLTSKESADIALYCQMCLSQLQKASKCLIVSAQVRSKHIRARKTNFGRIPEREPWNFQPHTPCRGSKSRKQLHKPTNLMPTREQNAPSNKSKRPGNWRQNQALQKTQLQKHHLRGPQQRPWLLKPRTKCLPRTPQSFCWPRKIQNKNLHKPLKQIELKTSTQIRKKHWFMKYYSKDCRKKSPFPLWIDKRYELASE